MVENTRNDITGNCMEIVDNFSIIFNLVELNIELIPSNIKINFPIDSIVLITIQILTKWMFNLIIENEFLLNFK